MCLPRGLCSNTCIVPSRHSHYSGIINSAHVSLLCLKLCQHIVRRPRREGGEGRWAAREGGREGGMGDGQLGREGGKGLGREGGRGLGREGGREGGRGGEGRGGWAAREGGGGGG